VALGVGSVGLFQPERWPENPRPDGNALFRTRYFNPWYPLPNATISEAHQLATILEKRLPAEQRMPTEVVAHLEWNTMRMSIERNTTRASPYLCRGTAEWLSGAKQSSRLKS
jgi:hypothetical protein